MRLHLARNQLIYAARWRNYAQHSSRSMACHVMSPFRYKLNIVYAIRAGSNEDSVLIPSVGRQHHVESKLHYSQILRRCY